ncbi:MAG: porin family protein [Bacteroidales bacterium]|nr:porin family protein [Bacteroidales bacterium]
MKAKLLSVLAFTMVLTVSATAQESSKKWGFELSGGPSFATSDFAVGLKPGFGTDGAFHYSFLPRFGVYAGWGANWISSENTDSELNRDYEETGYVLGLQFRQPIGTSKSAYFLRAGALYSHIEVENDNGDILEDTGHGFGVQLAAGMEFELGSSWSISPVVKHHFLSRDHNGADTDFNYLTVRLGIMKRF